MKKVVLFCLLINAVFAQTSRQVTDEQQVWAAYFNQTRFSDKWGLWGDFHFRTNDHFIKEPSKGIIRLGLMYYFNDDLKFTNGYAFINHFP